MIRILVAMDESPAAHRAAREAVRLFSGGSAEFLVLNVAQVPGTWVPPAPYGGVAVMPTDWGGEIRTMDEEEVEVAAKEAGVVDPHVLTEVGNPADRICKAAEDHDADVIVVGGHDKGLLTRLFDPSVSAAVVRGSHRPVLVVSGQPPFRPPVGPAHSGLGPDRRKAH